MGVAVGVGVTVGVAVADGLALGVVLVIATGGVAVGRPRLRSCHAPNASTSPPTSTRLAIATAGTILNGPSRRGRFSRPAIRDDERFVGGFASRRKARA
ncbi:MAG: hypothetical protein E6I88_12940 [Chloroflexi bacterium]|nr:MAG: hypothetical protein E6I88_12940 [Chloroflexota bacterium]